MNMDTLSIVEWGNVESLNEFLWENGVEHRLFSEQLLDQGIIVPRFPIIDASTENLDDWLLIHQVEHQAFASALNLDNPFNLLDVDWRIESDFYDWVANHYTIHRQIVTALNL